MTVNLLIDLAQAMHKAIKFMLQSDPNIDTQAAEAAHDRLDEELDEYKRQRKRLAEALGNARDD